MQYRLSAIEWAYGRRVALRAASLHIAAGERIAIVGANGSGKSTLLRVLQGLLVPQHGTVERAAALRQAFVFQRPWMLRASVLTNVALALWLHGTGWRAARQRAQQVLGDMGLAGLAGQLAPQLSIGQQQRVAIARAWALRPDVLLLDEPTSSLDPAGKKEIESLLAQIASSGTTLVFSSHNLGQVKRLAQRVLYLEQGTIALDMRCADFFSQPLPTAASDFLQGEL